MVPSPKLPTSRSLENWPKFADACTTPQGAFSVPPIATRRRNFPSVETVDQPQSRTEHGIVLGSILLGVRYKDQVVDDVHAMRSVAGRQVRIRERSAARVAVRNCDRTRQWRHYGSSRPAENYLALLTSASPL